MTDLAALSPIDVLFHQLKANPEEAEQLLDDPDVVEWIADAPWFGGLARPDQTPPDGDWFIWALVAGRGSGKTRAGSEWVLHKARTDPDPERFRCALIGPTLRDSRNVVVEGDSGLLSVLPPSMLVNGSVEDTWKRSMGEMRLANGAYFEIHASESPDRLRGPQWSCAWADEIAAFVDAPLGLQDSGKSGKGTTISNLLLACRLGNNPQVLMTSTPRPNALMRQLLDPEALDKYGIDIRVSRASTFANARNLAPQFMKQVVGLYSGGGRLGRQELYGELIELTGDVFDVSKLALVDGIQPGRVWRARVWDLAATEVSEGNSDPDWTVGALISLNEQTRRWRIEDIVRVRMRPGERDDLIYDTAIDDAARFGTDLRYIVEQEPGSGGKAQVEQIQGSLDGLVRVEGFRPTGRKYDRAMIASAAIDQGRVEVSDGPWLQGLLDEFGEFTADDTHPHDDQIDCLSTAFAVAPSGLGRRRRGNIEAPGTAAKSRNRPH